MTQKPKGIDTVASLEREYTRFETHVGIKLYSADEHLHDPHLDADERAYLRVFIKRWEAAQEREDTAFTALVGEEAS